MMRKLNSILVRLIFCHGITENFQIQRQIHFSILKCFENKFHRPLYEVSSNKNFSTDVVIEKFHQKSINFVHMAIK